MGRIRYSITLTAEKLNDLIDFYTRHTEYLCETCKHYIPCKVEDCEFYQEFEIKNKPTCIGDYTLSCVDLDYGTCEKRNGTLCEGCIQKNCCNFEWTGEMLD